MDADRREFLGLHGVALTLQQFLGLARAPRQLVDDVLRQSRRHAAPCRRQQIDEKLFAGRHAVDGDVLLQRHANGLAVGIAPRRADIIGRLLRHAADRNIERLLEADDQHIAGLARGAVDIFARREYQPRIAVAGGNGERRLDRRGSGWRRDGWRGKGQDQSSKSGRGVAAARKAAAKTKPLGGATARHEELKAYSTELDRQPGGRAFAAAAPSPMPATAVTVSCCA